MSEDRLAVMLEKVMERLAAGASNMERLGADLIAYYLDPDRLAVEERWSRKHAHTQARLCERLAVPVIGAVTCQDIEMRHAEDRQRRADAGGGRPDGADGLGPGIGWPGRRVPDRPAAGSPGTRS